MQAQEPEPVRWQFAEVSSPHLPEPVAIVAAKAIPYVSGGDRFQNLNLYLPRNPETSALVGTPAEALPKPDAPSVLPRYQVHIHGGAWRDPQLTSSSIEPRSRTPFARLTRPVPSSQLPRSTIGYPSIPTILSVPTTRSPIITRIPRAKPSTPNI